MELLRLEDVSKHFGAVRAVDHANLVIGVGEVVGIVGDNAAGKSTLMKIISGVYTPDTGRYLLESRLVHLEGPQDARQHGIEMVYQDFALLDNLDIRTNIFLGREPIRRVLGVIPVIDRRSMTAQSEEILRTALELDVASVREKVARLSGGQRQGVAIARALLFKPRLLIMDEPTASLSVAKIDRVLDVIHHLKAIGVALVIISHRLQEVFAVADRIVVMRHGTNVASLAPSETTIEEVIAYMIGGKGALGNEDGTSGHGAA